jgi:hypothetical protein
VFEHYPVYVPLANKLRAVQLKVTTGTKHVRSQSINPIEPEPDLPLDPQPHVGSEASKVPSGKELGLIG